MNKLNLTLLIFILICIRVQVYGDKALVEEIMLPCRQLTFSAKNHELDNNDNFSYDDRFICYDTRGSLGYGIENCMSIEIMDVQTGKEYVVYRPQKVRLGSKPAPGVGAVSFHPKDNCLVFIHGPELVSLGEPFDTSRIYAKSNRLGAIVSFEIQGSQLIVGEREWVDHRVVRCDVEIPDGAHRGGSHRHEFSGSGLRIGCTYDDALLPEYGRTVGLLERSDRFEPWASYYFAILVKVVPIDRAKVGDIVRAYGDSWVDGSGSLRAFIGTTKDEGGFFDYLYLVRIPEDIDISSSDSGSCVEYLSPPLNLRLRQVTKVNCSCIVRSSPDGKKIAYLDKDSYGRTQIFIADISNLTKDLEGEINIYCVTDLPCGVEENIRWHPKGKTIFSVSDGRIVATQVPDTPGVGRSIYISPRYRANKPYALVVSRKGGMIAYNRCVPTYDEWGNRVLDSAGKDFSQIFVIDWRDEDGSGLPEPW